MPHLFREEIEWLLLHMYVSKFIFFYRFLSRKNGETESLFSMPPLFLL
jgi:hypothetical protein